MLFDEPKKTRISFEVQNVGFAKQWSMNGYTLAIIHEAGSESIAFRFSSLTEIILSTEKKLDDVKISGLDYEGFKTFQTLIRKYA